jgi:hypothetical protein
LGKSFKYMYSILVKSGLYPFSGKNDYYLTKKSLKEDRR